MTTSPDDPNARRTSALGSFLLEIASQLSSAPREGADVDEPEGARYVQMSDSATRHLSEQLKFAATLADPFDPFGLGNDSFYEYANQVAVELRRRRERRAATQATRVSLR